MPTRRRCGRLRPAWGRVDLIRRWAAEAGLSPDLDAVRATMNKSGTLAEETLREFVAALGIR